MARIPFEELEAWMEQRGMRPAEAARMLGVSTQTFNGWRKRGQVSADASDSVLAHMGRGTTVSARATAGDYVRVEQLDAEAGMGSESINEDYPEVVRAMDFTPSYIRSLVGFVPAPGRLVLVTGRGDSMIPTIQPGESLLVDTGCTSYDGDGIYLVNIGNGQQIKRLMDHGLEAGVFIHSDNPAYPAIRFPRGAMIGGKVYLRNRIERFN
ncbi:TPA: S24 family peptidase [Stenotrophomonas maltophilia]